MAIDWTKENALICFSFFFDIKQDVQIIFIFRLIIHNITANFLFPRIRANRNDQLNLPDV